MRSQAAACRLVGTQSDAYSASVSSWFVVSDDGTARRVSDTGLVIGRAPTCDVVLREPQVSRRHLLVQQSVGGQLDIVPLSGAQTLVNGAAIDASVVARDGDVLTFPGGATLALRLEGARDGWRTKTAWLFDVRGRRIGLPRETLTIGGSDEDVVIEGWPPAAAQLTWHAEQLRLEPYVEGMLRNDAPLPRGTSVELRPDDRISWGEITIVIATETVDAAPTHREVHVVSITLEMLPSGGMLTIRTTRNEHRALLAERRFALAMVLLQPPEPFKAGEYIPDEIVVAAVWPRSETAGRGDLNQLVRRLRNDLRAAGLTRPVLVERYAKGGATRFVVLPGVAIDVHT